MILTESKQKVGYFLVLAFFLIVAGCGQAGTGSTTAGTGSTTGGTGLTTGSCVVGATGVTTATLTWTAPTTNTDGSALTDLAGYKIYYGTASGNYSSTAPVTGATTTSYTIGNLTSGNSYYFVVSALDTSGNESAYSVEKCKTIN